MNINNKIVFLFALCLYVVTSNAQLIEKGYYLFPINPGKPAYLAGNMGELRSNHFHAGLDIKTGGVEGLPIYCSADGFVSRIKVSAYGYGLALYVQHPNGQTTVYAHMSKFNDAIHRYTLIEQYKFESYEIDLYPNKSDFAVKKGEILGFSGNTGGSGGPHLHWEIRDAYSRVLNPLTAGFSEITDDITPVIYKVGFTTLSSQAHIKNEFGFFSFTPSKTGTNTYTLADITAQGEIGISINANDKLNGSANNNGVASIETYVNGILSYQYVNDRFTFASSKMINQHIEFDRYVDGFGHFHRCYVADGNTLDFYRTDENEGVLRIKDTSKYAIKMILTDAYNNKTTLTYNIIGSKIAPNFAKVISTKTDVKTKMYENILRVSTTHNGKDLKYYIKGVAYPKAPLYIKNSEAIYTFDLSKDIPDSIVKGNIHYPFNITHTIPPGREFTSYQKHAVVRFSKGDIKDTLYMTFKYNNDVFEIGDAYTPIYQNLKYILKPQNTYPNKSKTAVYHYNGSYYSFIGGYWNDNNNIEFSSNKMGTFAIKEDSKAPSVTLINASTKSIKLKIADDLSGVNKWRATLDGKYILMGYRYQTSTIQSLILEDSIQLKGLFKLELEDNMGNVTVFTKQL